VVVLLCVGIQWRWCPMHSTEYLRSCRAEVCRCRRCVVAGVWCVTVCITVTDADGIASLTVRCVPTPVPVSTGEQLWHLGRDDSTDRGHCHHRCGATRRLYGTSRRCQSDGAAPHGARYSPGAARHRDAGHASTVTVTVTVACVADVCMPPWAIASSSVSVSSVQGRACARVARSQCMWM
jgi:hypothetical protein